MALTSWLWMRIGTLLTAKVLLSWSWILFAGLFKWSRNSQQHCLLTTINSLFTQLSKESKDDMNLCSHGTKTCMRIVSTWLWCSSLRLSSFQHRQTSRKFWQQWAVVFIVKTLTSAGGAPNCWLRLAMTSDRTKFSSSKLWSGFLRRRVDWN